MKWIFLGVGIVLLAALVAVCFAKQKNASTDDIDGGVVTRRSGDDAPKVIHSTQISSFRLIASLYAVVDPGDLENCLYTFEAERKEEAVVCRFKRHNRADAKDCCDLSFETDAAFMDDMQTIIARYDLAQYNGFYHSVSGLPDMYGDSLYVSYDSGETIEASDNQGDFLPLEAIRDLRDLFVKASGEKLDDLPAEEPGDDFAGSDSMNE